MASGDDQWKDDDAFFIRQAEKEEMKKQQGKSPVVQLATPDAGPQPIKRDPSVCGLVDDINAIGILEEPDHAAFYLDEDVTHEAPLSPVAKKALDLRLLRDSPAIANNLKDEICSTLQERGINAEELLGKSDADVEFLFPEPSTRKAVTDWRQLEKWKRNQLPTEALRLVNAAKAGNLDVVKEITQKATIPPLGKPLLIDHRDDANHGRTPLMHAARHGHLAVVGYLVKTQNADIHARDQHKLQSMAIHFAAQGGYVEIVRFLVGIDANLVEAKNKHGDTPLNMAAVAGKLSVIECLVNEKHANLENRGQYGMTPLLCAAEKGHVHVVKFLVEKGADICAKDDRYADMGIHWAARFGHLDTVAFFIEKRASLIEAINALGRTGLHCAALGGHLVVVKYLVKKGANLLAMSNDGDLISNAIHLAAYFGHEQVVAFLLDSKPDLLEIENKDEKTPYMLAKEEKRVEILRLLESRGAKTTAKKKDN